MVSLVGKTSYTRNVPPPAGCEEVEPGPPPDDGTRLSRLSEAGTDIEPNQLMQKLLHALTSTTFLALLVKAVGGCEATGI